MTTSSKIIDVHSHPLLTDYVNSTNPPAKNPDGTIKLSPIPSWKIQDHIDMMDENGIDVCMLSLPEISGVLQSEKGAAFARRLNEEIANIIAKYQDRLGAFGAVPMDNMDAAISETNYVLDVLKFDGIAASTHLHGVYLGEPIYDAWFAEMDKRKNVLFIHPTKPHYFDNEHSRMNESVLEFMFDSTRMVTNLVLSGTKSKYPDINIITTHAGGTIPYLVNRLMLVSQMPWAYLNGPKLAPREVKTLLGSFYYDLTASTSDTQLYGLRQFVSAENLLMGFDFPLMPKQTIAPSINSFMADANFNEDEKNNILYSNALRLFPKFRDS